MPNTPAAVKEVIDRVLSEAGQTPAFRRQFGRFFENLATDNIGPGDLEDLIEQVKLREDE